MHEPVLLKEVIAALTPLQGESYLDATAGYGGHSSEIFRITQNYSESVLVDRDPLAVEYLAHLFQGQKVKILNEDFYSAAKRLREEGKQFDMILADLGVSSPHLNNASRGFSFQASGPLDMRMDGRQTLSAAEIVNEWSAEDLEDIIKRYGEEPRARAIATAIVSSRPLATTDELAQVIVRVSKKWQKTHPATRTFQALRIAVNNELGLLTDALPLWHSLLKPGGRLAIISFHSLEDRIVKQYFKEYALDTYDSDLRLISKNAITAGREEVVSNPRSRSAKLRVVAKIKTTIERTSDEN
jgi:16S rRNA (cytosine1402-N4)-methyltransferase